MRLALFFGSLLCALLLGVLTLQVPSPRGSDTPARDFSTARAMVDVREIAQRPHPVGSPDHARVQAYLMQRMAVLGLNPQLQTGPLSPDSIARLSRGADGSGPVATTATNIVGVLPGRDPNGAAIVLMAHYDTVPASPGAADDTTGVAAVLEAVRAIRTRSQEDGVPIQRPLIVLLTDAEEVGLDGARVFFTEHPLRQTVQAVVNLEARGGGGRASMFETGPGNAQTVALFAQAAARADGGATSNSLAVLVYRLMPNATDMTLAVDRGIAGLNLAFVGRPALYHSPDATPDALDQGSVQHIGSQALEATDTLLRTPSVPYATHDMVYSDVFGLGVVAYPPQAGWIVLGLAFALFAFAAWGARHATGLGVAEVVRGALGGLWFIATAVAVIGAVRLLAGPLLSRAESFDAYYVLMRRLPWIEAGAALSLFAIALIALAPALPGARVGTGRRILAGLIAALALLALIAGGVNLVILGSAAISVGLTLWPASAPGAATPSPWGPWLGLIGLIGLIATGLQILAPTAAFILAWPVLLASLAAALASLIGARLTDVRALIPAALVTLLGGGWLVAQAHFVFLGIGMDMPAVLVLIGVLILMLARPLAPSGSGRGFVLAAAACLVLACGLSVSARFAEPPAFASAPTSASAAT